MTSRSRSAGGHRQRRGQRGGAGTAAAPDDRDERSGRPVGDGAPDPRQASHSCPSGRRPRAPPAAVRRPARPRASGSPSQTSTSAAAAPRPPGQVGPAHLGDQPAEHQPRPRPGHAPPRLARRHERRRRRAAHRRQVLDRARRVAPTTQDPLAPTLGHAPHALLRPTTVPTPGTAPWVRVRRRGRAPGRPLWTTGRRRGLWTTGRPAGSGRRRPWSPEQPRHHTASRAGERPRTCDDPRWGERGSSASPARGGGAGPAARLSPARQVCTPQGQDATADARTPSIFNHAPESRRDQ